VQVSLEIWHDDGGDTCEALISPLLEFDLEPLRVAHEDAYQVDEGTLMLHIGPDTLTWSYPE